MIALTREEKRALVLLVGCFLTGAVLYFIREGSLALGVEKTGTEAIELSVGGAVLNPVKVSIPAGTRLGPWVREALPLEEADLAKVPLGKALRESTEIVVPLKGAKSFSRKLNLNSATQSELEKLPGVGPQMAQNILETRAAKRKFYSAEELKEVKGIGEKKFQALREYIEVK